MGRASSALKFHPEVMSPDQRRALSALGPLTSERGFYLGGGTALAIHLGHRRSDDLDWFTPERLSDPLLLAAWLRQEGLGLQTIEVAPGTLHGTMAGVRLSFLAYPYPMLAPLAGWPEYGCKLAALADLACMKLAAIAQRGAKKDFLDIYALGLRFAPLGDLLALYQRKYAVSDIGHVLYALSYFDDAEDEPTPLLLWDLDWPGVKNALRRWRTELVRNG